MVAGDFYRGGFESLYRKRVRPSCSALVRAMLRRRNLPTEMVWSKWNKSDELLILKGIVDYQNEKKLCYNSDWDALYAYIKDSMDLIFTKKQLISKVRKLMVSFLDNPVRSNSDKDQAFKLSCTIWATKNETQSECGSNEILDQARDVPNMEHGRVRNNSMEIDKEESLEDELCVLQAALEAIVFPSIDGNQQKLLLHNLKKLEAEKRNELSDEWKALLNEELQLSIKKLTYGTKLASAASA